MNQARTEYQVATDSLKLALKTQGVTYKELARRLRLSESGVKKILTARDGSFQRLAQICRELGVSMRELLRSEEESFFDVTYSLAQQEYLLAHPRALRLYWALVYERHSLNEARKLLDLTEKDAFSMLRRMDRLKLLEVLPGDRVRLPPVRQIRWVGGGPLIGKLYQDWSSKLVRSVATAPPGRDHFFLIRYFRASPRTIDDLIAALRDLEAEFVRRAIQDMRAGGPELKHLRWLGAVDQRSFLEV